MTTSTEHLKGIIRDASEELLRAERIESASITMGDKLILVGKPAALGRMLGYATQPIDRLTRQTAAFLAATGTAPHLKADHDSAEWKLFIAGCECGERSAAAGIVRIPLIREGDPAPGAAAASIPAGPVQSWESRLRLCPSTSDMIAAMQEEIADWRAAPSVAPAPESQPLRAALEQVMRPYGIYDIAIKHAGALQGDFVAVGQQARAALAAPESQPAAIPKGYRLVPESLPDAVVNNLRGMRGLDDGIAARATRALWSEILRALPVKSLPAPVVAPVPAASEGWTRNTGTRPVAGNVLVQVEVREGPTMRREAGRLDWSIEGIMGDIVRWRPAAPATSDKAE